MRLTDEHSTGHPYCRRKHGSFDRKAVASRRKEGALLADILGTQEPVARANTTVGQGIPGEAREVFEQRLLDQYGWDRETYRQVTRGS